VNIQQTTFGDVHPRMPAVPHLFVDGPYAGDRLDLDPTAVEIQIDGIWYNVDGGLMTDFPYISLIRSDGDECR
jgi:hypothetical protein